MEARFGFDFSNVRVHDGPRARASAAALEARAYTVGHHLIFGAGSFHPDHASGRHLLAHELAHVVQQRAAAEPLAAHEVTPLESASEIDARQAASAVLRGVPVRSLSTQPLSVARAGWGEKWDALWGVGPIDAYRASKIADEALAAAKKTGLPGLHNGPADAWRHCYWNCRMTASIGADQAETIANNHEADNPGPVFETMMDLSNNREGRECGGTSCDSCCQHKLDSGQLLVIDAKTGALTSSSATPRSTGTQRADYQNY